MLYYDEQNNQFNPNPPTMGYWEIITKIAETNNISLKEAIDKYYDISMIPNSTCYCALMGCGEYLFPFGSEIIICENKDELISYGIQPQYAGKKGIIKGIYIDEEMLCKDIELGENKKYINYLYYFISTDDSLYSCKLLNISD